MLGTIHKKMITFANNLGANRDKPHYKFLVFLFIPFARFYDKATQYLCRKVQVSTQYLSNFDEQGNIHKTPDTVRGYIIYRGNGCSYSFNNIKWEDVEGLIGQLESQNKKMTLTIQYGGGWHNDIPLTRWGRREMAKKLSELKKEHS